MQRGRHQGYSGGVLAPGCRNRKRHFLRLAIFSAFLGATGCNLTVPKMPWEHPSIAQVAPPGPMLPLVVPKEPLRGDKGPASARYPASFGVTIKPDGTILFPEGSPGKIKGNGIVVGGSTVATLSDSGEVSGSGLKHRYKFDVDGDLLDAEGRGLRLSPTGGIRSIGGPWHYKDVMQWSELGKANVVAKRDKDEDDGPPWDRAAWRTVAIVSLLMVENLLPEALRR